MNDAAATPRTDLGLTMDESLRAKAKSFGIVTDENFGTPNCTRKIVATGAASNENFGTPNCSFLLFARGGQSS
jgi:hypothetical protein